MLPAQEQVADSNNLFTTSNLHNIPLFISSGTFHFTITQPFPFLETLIGYVRKSLTKNSKLDSSDAQECVFRCKKEEICHTQGNY